MKFSYYLKWSFKQFRKYPLQTGINIFGLAIGVTVFSFILIYVKYQLSVDQFHDNVEHVYRVENGFYGITPAPYYDVLKDKLPEVKSICRMRTLDGFLQYTPDNFQGIKPGLRADLCYAEKELWEIFNYHLIRGDLQDIYALDNAIVISQQLANKLFGKEDPIGKMLKSEGSSQFVVKGIMADLPDNVSLEFDAVVPFAYMKRLFHDPHLFEAWGRWMYETFVLLEAGAEPVVVKSKINEALYQASLGTGLKSDRGSFDVALLNYGELYFTQVMDYHQHGNKKHVYIFGIVGLFVILIALINYVNITTALSSTRFKALGVKKIAGALRKDLIKLILFESIMVAFFAVVLAVLFIEFFTPLFQSFTDIPAGLPYGFGFLLIAFVVLPMFLGSIAGIFPAIFLSKFSLQDVLKGKSQSGRTANYFRNILTVVQFGIAVFLIAGTLLVYKQLQYISDYNPGYSIDQAGFVFTTKQIRDSYDSFKDQLLQQPGVKDVTRCNNIILQSGNFSTILHEEKTCEVYYYAVDEGFPAFFDLKLVKGRLFRPSDMQRKSKPVLITRELAEWYGGIDSALTQRVLRKEVIGVVEDMQTQHLRQKSNPLVIHLTSPGDQSAMVYIKVESKDYKQTLARIEQVWKSFMPELPMEFQFLDDTFESIYRAELQFGKVFFLFALIAICLACLGLFALISFVSLKRTKEIGVRKSLGATTSSIVLLLSKDLGKWVLLANILALPLAFYFLHEWLLTFQYRTALSWWIFVLSAAISLFIALSTIGYHTLRTARQNPVDALRYE